MARQFDDGATQYLSNANAPLTTFPVTMACWFNSDDDTITQTLVDLYDSGGGDYYRLDAAGGTAGDPVQLRAYDGAAGTNVVTTSGYSANTWHHACGVAAASDDRRVYIDGGSKGTSAVARNVTSLDSTYIGRNDVGGGREMSGAIAEVAIWNVALADAEVEILAHGVRPLFVRPASLVFYLPLIRDDDEDLIGGLSMTANNGPTVSAHCAMYYTASGIIGVGAAGIIIPPLAMHYYRKRRSKN